VPGDVLTCDDLAEIDGLAIDGGLWQNAVTARCCSVCLEFHIPPYSPHGNYHGEYMWIPVFFHTGNFDANKKHVSLNQHKSLNQHESHVQNPSSFEIRVAARHVAFALRCGPMALVWKTVTMTSPYAHVG
jgi:hypothetical protein